MYQMCSGPAANNDKALHDMTLEKMLGWAIERSVYLVKITLLNK